MKNTDWKIAAWAMVLGAQVHAQEPGEVHGKVLDPEGRPVEFCAVRALQGGSATGGETGPDGRFVLKPLPPGEYDVEVRSITYGTMEVTGVRVDPGLIVRLKDITLGTTLGTVTVERYKWEEPLIRPDDPSRMVITRTQIEDNAVRKDPVKLVASLTPGVTKAPGSDELYFRGARSGSMAWFVDGVKVVGNDPGVPADAISSITVYTGGLPAKYGDVTGGVVAMETKSYFDLYQQRNGR